MSGLAHYLEDEGIPTVIIALVREHAEQMRPPRALWVPYMLGAPNNPEVQTEVLRQALALLEADSGPLLVDTDVPDDPTECETAWVCPVSLPKAKEDVAALGARVERELAALRSWYDIGVERRGRTTVGLSLVSVEESARLLARYVTEPESREESDRTSVGDSLRWWASDIRSYYFEAVTAQPGDQPAEQLEHWFWQETAAGEMLLELRNICRNHEAEEIRDVGWYMVGDIDWQYYVNTKKTAAHVST